MSSFDAIEFTSCGGQAVNEDTARIVRRSGQFAAIVADGLGSHGGGDIASAAAADAAAQALPQTGITNGSALAACLEAANGAVLSRQTPGVPMKSTIVMLTIENGCAAFAHVGDTRGYLFRSGAVYHQTMDHSVSQMAVLRGDIAPSQIRFHQSRSQLMRALGGDEHAAGDVTPLGILQTGDAFLLCTDGFWEYVTEDEMCVDLMKAHSADEWMSSLLARIGRRVQEGHDNLSAIAVIYGGL